MNAGPTRPAREDRSQTAGHRLSAREALDFVRTNGVVVVSAKGRGPTLVEAIAGRQIKGSWWGDPDGKRIFAVLSAVTDSEEVLVCRLVDGKVTLVHRRLWPALVRLAPALAPERISRVLDGHTASGRHVSRAVPFPAWVPAPVLRDAEALSEEEAIGVLAQWLPASGAARGK